MGVKESACGLNEEVDAALLQPLGGLRPPIHHGSKR